MDGGAKGATRELDGVAREQRRLGISSAETMWQLALQSARSLDMVASEAEKYGDPVSQARALFEAAVQHSAISRFTEARSRMQRLGPSSSRPT
jgi:hypothetical protein